MLARHSGRTVRASDSIGTYNLCLLTLSRWLDIFPLENFIKEITSVHRFRNNVKIRKFRGKQTSLTYLKKGEQVKVESGDFPIIGYSQDGSIIVEEGYEAKFIPGSQWWISSHDATQNGTKVLSSILPNAEFSFPKSP